MPDLLRLPAEFRIRKEPPVFPGGKALRQGIICINFLKGIENYVRFCILG